MRAVFFDIGETLVRPDLGWQGVVDLFSNKERYLPEDLYPDAVPTLEALKKAGYFVGVVGNQPIEREADMLAMNITSLAEVPKILARL